MKNKSNILEYTSTEENIFSLDWKEVFDLKKISKDFFAQGIIKYKDYIIYSKNVSFKNLIETVLNNYNLIDSETFFFSIKLYIFYGIIKDIDIYNLDSTKINSANIINEVYKIYDKHTIFFQDSKSYNTERLIRSLNSEISIFTYDNNELLINN